MSFSIGSTGPNMGPRGALRSFGEESGTQVMNWHVIARLLAYLRPHWQRMTLAFACMLVASGLTLLTPYLVKVAIDQYITQGDIAGLNRVAIQTTAAFLGIYVATWGQRYLLAVAGCDYVQGNLFSKPLPPEEFEKLLNCTGKA